MTTVVGALADGLMDRHAAAAAVVQVWESAGTSVETLEDGAAWVTADGTLVTVDGAATRISRCLRRGMPCTPLLLDAVAQLNQSAAGGTVWLVDDSTVVDSAPVEPTEGPDSGATTVWAAVWSVAVPHAWTSPLHLQRTAYSCLVELAPHLRELACHLAGFGGRDELPTGLDLWEMTGLRQLAVAVTVAESDEWPAGGYPTGHSGWAGSAVEHDERNEQLERLGHGGSSFPPPIPIPIAGEARAAARSGPLRRRAG